MVLQGVRSPCEEVREKFRERRFGEETGPAEAQTLCRLSC